MIYFALIFIIGTTKIDSLIIEAKHILKEATDSQIIEEMEDAKNQFLSLLGKEEKAWLIYYYLGYICNVLFDMEKEKYAKRDYIKEGILYLDKSIKLNPRFAESYALLAHLYGKEITVNPSPFTAVRNGVRWGILMDKAYKLEKYNPRVWMIEGISKLYTLPILGGGSGPALERFIKAAELFETYKIKDETYPSWGADEVYVWIGRIYMKKDKEKAKECFNIALKINPECGLAQYWLAKLEEKIY